MKKQVDIRKATVYSVAINGVQIVAVTAIALYLFLSGEQMLYQSAARVGILAVGILFLAGGYCLWRVEETAPAAGEV